MRGRDVAQFGDEAGTRARGAQVSRRRDCLLFIEKSLEVFAQFFWWALRFRDRFECRGLLFRDFLCAFDFALIYRVVEFFGLAPVVRISESVHAFLDASGLSTVRVFVALDVHVSSLCQQF